MSEGKVQCPLEECQARLGPRELRPHLSNHLRYYLFRCGHCQSFFISKDKLQFHAKLNENCRPVQVVEDPQEEKEMELQELIKKMTTDSAEPVPETFPTPPPFPSPCVVGSVAKENLIPPSDTSVSLSGPSKGNKFKKEQCSICEDVVSVNVKSVHVKRHVKRIKAGKEPSKHAGLSSEVIYGRIRSVCFPDTTWDNGSKRQLETSSGDEADESGNEQREKSRHSKCKKWAFEDDEHSRDHAQELMKDEGRSLGDKDGPNTNWRSEARTLIRRLQNQDRNGKIPAGLSAGRRLVCQKCDLEVHTNKGAGTHSRKHTLAQMDGDGVSRSDNESYLRIFSSVRQQCFPDLQLKGEGRDKAAAESLAVARVGTGINCVICEVPVSNLRHHVLKKHMKRAPIQCPRCNFKQYSKAMPPAREHMETVHGESGENLIDRREEMKPEFQSWLETCFPDHVNKFNLPENDSLLVQDVQFIKTEHKRKDLFDYFSTATPTNNRR